LNQKKNTRNFTPILIGLEAERSVIYDRINQRVDIMINEGLLAEAKALFPNKNLNALQTVGYRELFSYFEGEISLEFAIEEIKKNTRRFAKRQLTWFKRKEEKNWFDYLTDRKKIIEFIILK
jgi:tRNA dimethylallyltransferase